MEDYIMSIGIPAIACFVYVVLALLRFAIRKNTAFDRWIPLLSAVLGAISGVVCYFAIPAFPGADNVVSAIVVGGASGLSATGTHQLFKQFAGRSSAETDPKKDPAPTPAEGEEQEKTDPAGKPDSEDPTDIEKETPIAADSAEQSTDYTNPVEENAAHTAPAEKD